MAMQVTLALTHPAGSDGTTLRLDSNSAGISITDWTPKVGNDGDAYVDEVLTLLIKGSSHDDLASKVQALDAMILQVPYFHCSAQQKGIFLRCQLTNETGARQALVLAARRENATALYGAPASPGNVVESYKLVLRRMPWWERADDVEIAVQTLAHCVGGMVSFSSIPGDVPARLMPITFSGHDGGGGFQEFWAGFRTARYGTLANFNPIWQLKDGGEGTDTAPTVDATAYGGSRMTCTFATTIAMASRTWIGPGQVDATYYADQRGRFLVLLRARGAGTGTAYVRMGTAAHGPSDSGDWRPRVAVPVSAAWHFYPLGEVVIPPTQWREQLATGMLTSYVVLQASGPAAMDLYLDCLVMVPVDEGFVHVSDGLAEYSGGNTYSTGVGQEVDGRIYSLCPLVCPNPSGTSPASFFLPLGDSKLVVAAEEDAGQVLANHCNVTVAYVPRWAMLRGAE